MPRLTVVGALGCFRQSYIYRAPAFISSRANSRKISSTAHYLAKYPSSKNFSVDQPPVTDAGPYPDEYSKSGGDDLVARQTFASYDKQHTTPESSKDRAGKGNDTNPLEVSPASQEVSFHFEETRFHPESGLEKTEVSRKGSAVKGKAVDASKLGEGLDMPKGRGGREYNKVYKEYHSKEVRERGK